jgi:hypothetical protein
MGVDGDAVRELAEALAQASGGGGGGNTHVRTIDLRRNPSVGADGWEALAEAIPCCVVEEVLLFDSHPPEVRTARKWMCSLPPCARVRSYPRTQQGQISCAGRGVTNRVVTAGCYAAHRLPRAAEPAQACRRRRPLLGRHAGLVRAPRGRRRRSAHQPCFARRLQPPARARRRTHSTPSAQLFLPPSLPPPCPPLSLSVWCARTTTMMPPAALARDARTARRHILITCVRGMHACRWQG